MTKLSAQSSNQYRPFKPKMYQGKRKGQSRNNYDQGRYQRRYRLNSRDRYSRPSYRGRSQYVQNYRGNFRKGKYRETLNPIDYFKLDIKALEEKNHRQMYDRLTEKERQVIELDFGDTPDKLKKEYLDMYDRVRSEILHTIKSDKNSDLSTSYLGRIDMTRSDKIKEEERFPI